MELRVIDFEILTTHYKNYRAGVDRINAEREKIIKEIEPLQKEMNQIISSATNGIILNGKTQQEQAERFQDLQKELMQIDSDFKHKNKQMVDELNLKSYDELSEIITEWAIENSIDVVSGKMEIIYASDKWDVTEAILDILKSKDLWVELPVKLDKTEKESV